MRRVDDAARAEAFDAAKDRRAGEAILAKPLHQSAVERLVVPHVGLSDEDPSHHLLAIQDAHGALLHLFTAHLAVARPRNPAVMQPRTVARRFAPASRKVRSSRSWTVS